MASAGELDARAANGTAAWHRDPKRHGAASGGLSQRPEDILDGVVKGRSGEPDRLHRFTRRPRSDYAQGWKCSPTRAGQDGQGLPPAPVAYPSRDGLGQGRPRTLVNDASAG